MRRIAEADLSTGRCRSLRLSRSFSTPIRTSGLIPIDKNVTRKRSHRTGISWIKRGHGGGPLSIVDREHRGAPGHTRAGPGLPEVESARGSAG